MAYWYIRWNVFEWIGKQFTLHRIEMLWIRLTINKLSLRVLQYFYWSDMKTCRFGDSKRPMQFRFGFHIKREITPQMNKSSFLWSVVRFLSAMRNTFVDEFAWIVQKLNNCRPSENAFTISIIFLLSVIFLGGRVLHWLDWGHTGCNACIGYTSNLVNNIRFLIIYE